ncbi:MAG TPA: hypothetical protein VFQ39_02545, partial [Longimicrobium sp.]|nr:hypothetical protein [Longimicrobium sp.]
RVAKFARYDDVDGDGIAARTLPGVSAKGAYFTRGSGHDRLAAYTEDSAAYQEVVDRIARKLAGAAEALPEPEIRLASGDGDASSADAFAPLAVVTIGGCRGAVLEAVDRLSEEGIALDFLRVRGFPFSRAVGDFLRAHERVFVVEQNRDAQLRSLLILETGVSGDLLVPLLDYGGVPLSARRVVEGVLSQLAPVPA